jgi:hypothetical protein
MFGRRFHRGAAERERCAAAQHDVELFVATPAFDSLWPSITSCPAR